MSGAGTNAGIEYQQRVASLLLAYQYGRMDIAGMLGFHRPGHIIEARFETDSPIDDIGVLCEEKWRVDFQVKRALSLSEENDSDFTKVIVQFIKTFVADQTPDSFFCLISELPLCLGGIVPLISDPRRFQELESNWRTAGFGDDKLSLKLVKDDRDFDNWMRRVFEDGLHPVIDPMFDKNQKLVSGIIVQHQEAMMTAALEEQAKEKSRPRTHETNPLL